VALGAIVTTTWLIRMSLANEAQGLTILLVEQNVGDALQMCQRAYVMERGSIVKAGHGAALLDDPDVRRAYVSI
jgi:branched-chain amino acid transport system ATP-binding protein